MIGSMRPHALHSCLKKQFRPQVTWSTSETCCSTRGYRVFMVHRDKHLISLQEFVCSTAASTTVFFFCLFYLMMQLLTLTDLRHRTLFSSFFLIWHHVVKEVRENPHTRGRTIQTPGGGKREPAAVQQAQKNHSLHGLDQSVEPPLQRPIFK